MGHKTEVKPNTWVLLEHLPPGPTLHISHPQGLALWDSLNPGGTLFIDLRFSLELELDLVSSKAISFSSALFSVSALREILDEMKTKIIFPCSSDWPVPQSWQSGVKCGSTWWEGPESDGGTFVHWENSGWQNMKCVHICYVHRCMYGGRVGWGAREHMQPSQRHDDLSQSDADGETRCRKALKRNS